MTPTTLQRNNEHRIENLPIFIERPIFAAMSFPHCARWRMDYANVNGIELFVDGGVAQI